MVRALAGRALTGNSCLRKVLQKHFEGVQLGEIVAAAREFPMTSRVDLQVALDQIFEQQANAKLLGILSLMMGHQPASSRSLRIGAVPKNNRQINGSMS